MNNIKLSELKFVAYLRKSTDREDKQIQSLDTQLKEVKRLAESQDFEILEYITESKSAKKPLSREGFNTMVEAIKSGKYNALVSISPDRLSRNAVDAGVLAELLTEGLLKCVVTSGADYESNPMSIMMLQFLMMNAKLDNMMKADKVRGGLASKIEKGWFPGVAPQGYLNTRLPEKGNNKIVKDPERFDMIRKLWDMVLTGAYTVSELVKIADEQWGYRSVMRNRQGGTPISRSGLYDIFNNPFYYGYFLYNGELCRGAHEPMVTKQEFESVQEILGRPYKRRPKRHINAFTGLIRCATCGCAITSTHKEKYYPKTDNKVNYDYYHCTKRKKHIVCSQPYITEKDLKDQIVEITSSIEIPEDLKDWATTYLIEKANYESHTSMRVINSQQDTYKNIEKGLSELMGMRMNREITPDEYSFQKKELTIKRDTLKDAMEDYEKARDKFKEDIMETFNFAYSAREKFEHGEIEEKREVLSKLGQNLLLDNGKLTIDLKKSLLVFKKSKNPDYMENKRSELVDVVAVVGKYRVPEPLDVSWLPRVDSNHEP